VHGVRDGILVDALELPAERRDGVPGLVRLLGGHGALHRNEEPTDRDVGQAQLRQHRQARDRAGNGNVVLLPAGPDVFLGPARLDAGLDTQLRQDFAQPVGALAERIEQRQLDGRLRDLERHAREACSAADIHNTFVFERHGCEQREAVEKMELGDGLRLGDGGEVHDLVFFQQQFAETAEGIGLRVRQREAVGGKPRQ